MASVLHCCARTTPCLRAEFQASQESTGSLAARHCLNPKTVKKWRSRTTTADAPMGPQAPRSTVLMPAEEAIVVTFRQKTLLPLDDVLGCLRDIIPNLSRSALHRCLQRHGCRSRRPRSSASNLRPTRSAPSTSTAASDQIDKGARVIAAIGDEIATGLELLDQDWCDGLVGNLALQLDCYDTDRMIERYKALRRAS